MKDVAQPRDELLAVPVGTDAVELLAHPPAGQVGVVLPALGQQQRRGGGDAAAAGRDWLGRQRPTDAGLLGGIATQLAEVLAGAPLDRQRLVAPRRAGA